MVSSKEVLELTPYRLLPSLVVKAAEQFGANIDPFELEAAVSEAPSNVPGDYGVPLARAAKKASIKPTDLLEAVKRVSGSVPVIRSLHFVRGYLNLEYNVTELSKLVFSAVKSERNEYGLVKTGKPLRVVIEHTSANPVHPLHIGHGRNASLGDSLARLLRARGHIVQTRFYINDVGRQVAVLVYGVMIADLKPPRNVKPDHWIGLVYAITHTLVDLRKAKDEAEKLKREGRYEEYREKIREVDELVAVLSKLRERNPELFDKLAEAINRDPDPEKTISSIMASYEYKTDEKVVNLVRQVVSYCLEGFKQTLKRLRVEFDVWDWESDLAWESLVSKILNEAKRNPSFTVHKGAYALELADLLDDKEVVEKLNIPKGLEVPPLILVRSDGTTLYTTRDIAYTIKKFRDFNADMVINVIAAEQRLEQIQVRLALIKLGYRREGLNTIHYAYEMVNLPGMAMSGRRGQYVTLDELLDRAKSIALSEIAKRSPDLSGEEAERIAEAIASSAVRFSLVSVAPSKPITFDVNEALNFERNSAPYLQYTHARASGILRKYEKPIDWESIDYSTAEEDPLRRSLIIQLVNYPYFFVKAADELRPEILVSYLLRLADIFNTWYQRDPVIRESEPGKRNFKLALVYAVKNVLSSGLSLLGVEPLERM